MITITFIRYKSNQSSQLILPPIEQFSKFLCSISKLPHFRYRCPGIGFLIDLNFKKFLTFFRKKKLPIPFIQKITECMGLS